MGSSGPPPCPRELFRSWSWDNSTGVVLAPLWSGGLRMPWPALWTAALCTLTCCVCQNSEPRGQGCLNWEPPLLSSSPTLGLTSGQDCGPSGPTLLGGCNALAAGVPQPSSPPSRDCGRTSWETLRQVMGAPSHATTWGRALWALLLTALGCEASQPLGGESVCTARPLAKYSITFTGKWSQTAFPKQYPLFRPPAQWSSLLGAAHSSDYSLWRKNQYVSDGLRDFAERGEAWALMREMEAAGEKLQSVHEVFSAPAVPSGTGQTSAELEAHSRHSLVSFVVRIVPSPDWFVGVDSLDLCDGDRWREQVAVDLYPYDAGTDSGFTFSSPNFATIPQDTVTEITSSSPSHPANSFYYPRLKSLPPIARVTLVRLRQNPRTFLLPAPSPAGAGGGNEIADSLSVPETPLDCEVSLWSSWGLCGGPCGQLGAKSRTRYIRVQPANQGAPCPELEEEAECVPDNCV